MGAATGSFILLFGMNEWQTLYLRLRMDLRLIETFEKQCVKPNQIQWIRDKFGTAMVFNNVHKYAEESRTAAGDKRADDDETSENDKMNNKEKQVSVLEICVSEAEGNKYTRISPEPKSKQTRNTQKPTPVN